MNALLIALMLAGAFAQPPAPGQQYSPERLHFHELLTGSTKASDEGRYEAAVDLARQAIAQASRMNDGWLLAIAHNRAGLSYMYAGNYAEADREFRTGNGLYERAGDIEGRAETLGNLANVQFFVGKYADASVLYEQALKVTSTGGNAPWVERRRRILLNNEATLFLRLGRDRDALSIYQTLTAAGTLKPREEAQLRVNLGVVYRRLGDPVKALESYDRASRLFAGDRDVDGELGARINRGIVLAAELIRLEDAEVAFGEALGVAVGAGNRRETGHAYLYRGETRVRAHETAAANEDFTQALALARELKTPEEEWKALFGLGRTTQGPAGIAYLDQAVRVIEQLRENIRVPSMRVEFLNDKRDVYDALIAARLRTADVSAVFNLLERSHSRGWRERLGLPGTVELNAVQAALPERALLLDYWHSSLGAAVVAVTRQRAAVLPFTIQPADVTALLDDLSSPNGSRWRETAARLAVLVPSADWFDGIEHVIVVPDGAVALVPFELLPAQGRMVIERASVGYTPTAATLLRAPTGGAWRPPWAAQLRAFADPVFDTSGESSEALPQLRAADAEVREVAAQLAGRSTLHVGDDDRKAYLFSLGFPPILHLATHALADSHAIEQSRLFFSPPDGKSGRADYLFLREAYELPLQGVELAVLSACDTERGPSARAEGVQSFSRAFLAAGARTTVTTLWRVADGPTAEFMSGFYHHLQTGAPRDEALRRAKLRFLQSGRPLADPHFWAAFVLTGEGARPVSRAMPWSYVAAALAIAALLCVVAVIVARQTRARARPSNAA